MSDADWSLHTGSLGTSDVLRGVSTAYGTPNGGDIFAFGFRSVSNNAGVVALSNNQSNFYPIASGKGVSVRGAVKRGTTADDYAIMLYGAMEDKNVTADGYLLGFTEDEDAAHLVLIKGSPSDGILTTSSGILRTSNGTYNRNTWYHFRLDIIAQGWGDTHIQLFENADLATDPVTAPDWQPIAGMSEYIDDQNGVQSGSTPFNGGYAGFAFYTGAIGRTAFVDHVQVARQTT
ncbi:MAG: hypothetical protein GTN69_01875 [Armatimonadetes bacterium]|nr:hypothetical protein [Armatimonadota bacterium]